LIRHSEIQVPLTTSSVGSIAAYWSLISSSNFNAVGVTTAGTGVSTFNNCNIQGGTSSAVSVGAGTTVECNQCIMNSSNTNVVTGAGTFNFSDMVFSGNSSVINPTTVVGKYVNLAQSKATTQPAFSAYNSASDADATGDTFKGAINLSLDKLMTRYPNLKILLVTPVWRSRQVNGDDLESDNNPNSLGLYLRDYVEAIKDMGKKYHVPVLDLYNTSGINKYTKELYLSSDGLHPNSTGYTHLANLIAAKLSSTY